MLNMLDPVALEDKTNKKLTEFIQNVHNIDFVWMDEILEEAIKIFKSSFDGEPELMPKTPSQKNRSRKKGLSSMKTDQLATRRSSKRNSARIRTSKRISQNAQRKRELEIQRAELENISPCVRVTRSKTARSFKSLSVAAVKNPVIDLAKGRIPLVEISANERRSAEGQIENMPPQLTKVAVSHTLSPSPAKRSTPLSEKSVIIIQDISGEKFKKEVGRTACKLKIANVCVSKTIENEEPSAEKLFPEQQADKPLSEPKATLNLNEAPQTPIVSKGSRRSVRRSLMGRASTNSRASLANRYSLSTKREQIVLRRSSRTVSKQESIQKSSVHADVKTDAIKEKFPDKESTESRATLDSMSHSQEVDENLNKFLCSDKTGMPETPQSEEKQNKGDREEDSSEMSVELQKQPLSARRKPSYKRAISDRDDGQHTEEELSPPRKKTVSPQCPASKVVGPFKTFLHTVQKNQMLMTPASVNRKNTIKSFLRQNTPHRFTPKEKERQRLENLRKKEEAEQQRKKKMEEEKKRRLEEMKRKREERLRKVLQARERVEQLEEEKKKRLEQKLTQHEEKNEKVREEKMAEGKIKKRAVAKKLEELEARRKQEEDARKQRALQLEEEERRRKELMQKKREEEQERARKIAEQHQAELEREKELSAKRELEKKQEQERIQAQRKHEQQEKEKAARLQKEVLQAAKEKERLRKEMEEKERKLQDQRKQEEELLKTISEPQAKDANKQLNVTVIIENSPICNSYPMTPQGPKQPKIDINNYGMDLNSDDSTDDESQPRKTIPAWASGNQLNQAIMHQYYNPPNTKALFGVVKSPKLEEIFDKSKPRYFKRTSSAVWNSPPFQGGKSVSSAFKRF
ncbi:inner centromere protein isoform X2 [Ahaetulla prasina]|uniref:inner centromere protein isoform X2 n=1 Tax=Ahaetulla prasina TaxID=499056 RepID=UPI002648B77E|nr:inner centromere protein isoform X2 [Ahaetulla prasina]